MLTLHIPNADDFQVLDKDDFECKFKCAMELLVSAANYPAVGMKCSISISLANPSTSQRTLRRSNARKSSSSTSFGSSVDVVLTLIVYAKDVHFLTHTSSHIFSQHNRTAVVFIA